MKCDNRLRCKGQNGLSRAWGALLLDPWTIGFLEPWTKGAKDARAQKTKLKGSMAQAWFFKYPLNLKFRLGESCPGMSGRRRILKQSKTPKTTVLSDVGWVV